MASFYCIPVMNWLRPLCQILPITLGNFISTLCPQQPIARIFRSMVVRNKPLRLLFPIMSLFSFSSRQKSGGRPVSERQGCFKVLPLASAQPCRCPPSTTSAYQATFALLRTEVQPIKIVIALARVSCARTFSNVALPKWVNKINQTRDSIPDQVKFFANLGGPLLVLLNLLSLWAVPP